MVNRYFHRLHTLTGHNGLPYLSAMFENLLRQSDPLLYIHLARGVSSTPLSHAFKWIVHAFVGTLDVEQVLLLWDRIIGFDAPELLAVVAAAVYVFHREALMGARCEKDVQVFSIFFWFCGVKIGSVFTIWGLVGHLFGFDNGKSYTVDAAFLVCGILHRRSS